MTTSLLSARSLSLGVLLPFVAAPAVARVRIGLCAAAPSLNTACQWVDVQTRLLARGQFAAVDILNVSSSGIGMPNSVSWATPRSSVMASYSVRPMPRC